MFLKVGCNKSVKLLHMSFYRKDDSPVNSVLAVHKQVGSLLNRFDKLLQDTEKERLDLENEVILLKKKLGYDTEHGKDLGGLWL